MYWAHCAIDTLLLRAAIDPHAGENAATKGGPHEPSSCTRNRCYIKHNGWFIATWEADENLSKQRRLWGTVRRRALRDQRALRRHATRLKQPPLAPYFPPNPVGFSTSFQPPFFLKAAHPLPSHLTRPPLFMVPVHKSFFSLRVTLSYRVLQAAARHTPTAKRQKVSWSKEDDEKSKATCY